MTQNSWCYTCMLPQYCVVQWMDLLMRIQNIFVSTELDLLLYFVLVWTNRDVQSRVLTAFHVNGIDESVTNIVDCVDYSCSCWKRWRSYTLLGVYKAMSWPPSRLLRSACLVSARKLVCCSIVHVIQLCCLSVFQCSICIVSFKPWWMTSSSIPHLRPLSSWSTRTSPGSRATCSLTYWPRKSPRWESLLRGNQSQSLRWAQPLIFDCTSCRFRWHISDFYIIMNSHWMFFSFCHNKDACCLPGGFTAFHDNHEG